MKNNFIKFSLGVVLTFAFMSCNNNEELAAVKPQESSLSDYTTEKGYLEFKNVHAYQKVYDHLLNASDVELNCWNSQLPFKTMKVKMDADEIAKSAIAPTVDYDLDAQKEMNDKILNSLLNEKGILVCGDSILKLKNGFVYLIKNKNFASIASIDKNEDISNDTNIVKKPVLVKLQAVQAAGGRQNVSWRTNVNEYRKGVREFVEFEAYLANMTIGQEYFQVSIAGKEQKKYAWVWWPPYDANLEYCQLKAVGTFDSDLAFWSNGILVVRPTNPGVNWTGTYWTNRNNCFYAKTTAIDDHSSGQSFDVTITFDYKMPHSGGASFARRYTRDSFNWLGN